MRAKTGTRIEETARLADQVETSIRQTIPPAEVDNILDNIGLPFSNINYIYNNLGTYRGGRRRRPGLAEREAPPDRGLRAHAAREAAPRISRGYVLFPSG